MSTYKDPILARISAFLARSGMSKTGLGVASLKDPRAIHEVLKGRELRRKSRERVETYIKNWRKS